MIDESMDPYALDETIKRNLGLIDKYIFSWGKQSSLALDFVAAYLQQIVVHGVSGLAQLAAWGMYTRYLKTFPQLEDFR